MCRECTAVQVPTAAYMQLVGQVTSEGVQLPPLLLRLVQLRSEGYHLPFAAVHYLRSHT